MITWTELTKENEPDKEVLAIGRNGEVLVGYISGDTCEADGVVLEDVDFFITVSDLKKLPRETKTGLTY
jgi:hypothetical protein